MGLPPGLVVVDWPRSPEERGMAVATRGTVPDDDVRGCGCVRVNARGKEAARIEPDVACEVHGTKPSAGEWRGGRFFFFEGRG